MVVVVLRIVMGRRRVMTMVAVMSAPIIAAISGDRRAGGEKQGGQSEVGQLIHDGSLQEKWDAVASRACFAGRG
jgi:hypothetical protein